MKRFILFMMAVAFTVASASAQQADSGTATATTGKVAATAELDTKKKDKSQRFLPTTRRIDRGVDKNKFVYRGEVMLGLAASYGTMDAADADLMLLVDDINFGLNRLAIKPYVAYAYRDNHSIGVRFGYEMLSGDLDNINLDLGAGSDLSFGLGGIGLENESFSWSLFHRNYMGLDRRGIVGVILESELLVRTGTSSFYMMSDGEKNLSNSRNFAARLNFNPGLAVYVFPEVCVTVTVGIGGLYYNNVRQEDLLGEVVGRRDRSGLKFKFNVADIQIGIVAHLWNKKKK